MEIVIKKEEIVADRVDELKEATSATIHLKFPFEDAGDAVTELKMTRPKAKHFKGVSENGGADQSYKLIAKLAGISPIRVGEVDGVDLQRVNEVLEGFLSAT